jgi:hypothetical protein
MLVDEFSGVLLQCCHLILPKRMYRKEITLHYLRRWEVDLVDQYLDSVCGQIQVMNLHKFLHSALPEKAT